MTRRQAVRVGGALVVACALVVTALELPGALDLLHDRVAANASLTPNERLLAAGGFDPDRTFLVQVAGFLPGGATYAIETGPNVQVSTPLTLSAIEPYVQWLLLPRRRVRPAEASWLLCYGCDRAPHAERFEPVWENGQGLSIERVRG